MELTGVQPPRTEMRSRLFDLTVAILVALPSLAFALAQHHRLVRPLDGLFLLCALGVVPLVWRRRFPIEVFAITGGATVVSFVAYGRLTPLALAALVALYTVAVSCSRAVSSIAVLGAVVACSALMIWSRTLPHGFVDVLFPTVIMGAVWLIGDNLRVRRAYVAELEDKAARAEVDRLADTARATASERARIARELHDVVAHHVSVIAVQAAAARVLTEKGTNPSEARAAVLAVEETARQALGELRQLLGVLRHDGDATALSPQPGLAQLDRLVADVRDAGIPVEVHVEGHRRALPPAVDLSAYRIVQEALTNVLKHAGTSPTTVALRFGDDELDIEVTDLGEAPGTFASLPRYPSPTTPGQGLVGMRERVGMFGGALDAGPRPGGGFTVRARLPLVAILA